MRIEFKERVRKELKKMSPDIRNMILSYLNDIASLENPRSRGKSLTANYSGYWRYRIGDYRIICEIIDAKLVIEVVKVGHRRVVYEPTNTDGRTYTLEEIKKELL